MNERPTPLETRARDIAASLTGSEDDLLAELGLRATVIGQDPEISNQLAPTISPHKVPLPPKRELIKLGRRILATWNREVYKFVCVDTSETSADREKLVAAIMKGDTTAAALITKILIGIHLLNPAVAVIVAVLITKVLIVPAGRNVCDVWKENLPDDSRAGKQ